jgi:ABC-type uncharacterized transport system substrate-binding protein
MKTLSIASAVVMFAGALLSAAEADNVKKVDILVMSDTPQLLEVRDGILEGLKARGYIEGKNLTINFKSAQANFGTGRDRSNYDTHQPGGGSRNERHPDRLFDRDRSARGQARAEAR